MHHQAFDDDEAPVDDDMADRSRKPSTDDEPNISFAKLLICEQEITLKEGLNFLTKMSKKYTENSLKKVFSISGFPFSDQNDIRLFNTHFVNENIDIIYGCITVTAKIVQLFVMNEHQNVLVNFKHPATLCNLVNGDKITLGDYNGRFQISNSTIPQIENRNGEASNTIKSATNCSHMGNITPPTPNKINALERSIQNISNSQENVIEEFYEATTQKSIDEPSNILNVSNESQINNELFQSPIIPAKYHQHDKSRSKKIKLLNSTFNDLDKDKLMSEDSDSQNLLAGYEPPKKNHFYKSSTSKKRPRNIPPLLDFTTNSCYNDKNDKPKSGFSTNANINNRPLENDNVYLENDDINALYSNCNTRTLQRYADKYGDKNDVSDYDTPTQKICIDKPNTNRSSIDRNENQFKVPTRKAIPEKSFQFYQTVNNQNILPRKILHGKTVVKPPKPNMEQATISTLDPFDAPTQIIVQGKKVVKPLKPNVELAMISTLDPLDAPTQMIVHGKKSVEPLKPNVESAINSTLDPFDAPTQMIVHRKKSVESLKPNVESAINSTLDPFDAPTQMIVHRKKSVEPNVESAINCTLDPFDAPTQIIVHEKTDLKPPEPDLEQTFIRELDPFEIFTQIDVQENPTCSKSDDAFSEKANLAAEKISHVEKLNSDVIDPYDCPTQIQPIDIHLSIDSIEHMVVEKSASSPGHIKTRKENQNYYSSTQQLENDLLSQMPINQNESNKTFDKKNSAESPNRASSPEDPYGFRGATTPVLAQKYIASKDVVLSPLEDDVDSAPEELEPITHRRKFPKKRLKLTNSEEESEPIAHRSNFPKKRQKLTSTEEESDLELRVLKVVVEDILTSKSNSSHLAENNHAKNVPSSSKKRTFCNMNVSNTSLQPEIIDPLQNSFNMRKRRSTIQKPVYKIMLTLFEGDELQKYEKIIYELGGTVGKHDGNVLVSKRVSRSFKSLKSVSLGIPLVSTTWLTDSHKCARFLDPKKYIFVNQNYKYSNPPSHFLKGWTIYTSSNMSKSMSEDLEELIKYNGGIHIKISPEQQNLHEFTMNILYRDKIFSLYDKNPDLNIDLPTPQIEVMHFCSMILQQKLDFPK